jgi:PAS domain S-box-containing protein
MMHNTLTERIRAAEQRLEALRQEVGSAPECQARLLQAVEACSAALKELAASHQELDRKPEEWPATQQAVESERLPYRKSLQATSGGYLVTDAGGVVQEANRAASTLLQLGEKDQIEHFRLIADFTHDWEYWVGPDGTYRYCSPSCERITGYPPAEFFRNPRMLFEIVHPDDLQILEAHRHERSEQGAVHSVDFRIVARSGEERWINHVCQTVYGADGTFLGRRGSNRDVTERKVAEQALRRERDLASAILSAAGALIVVLDREGHIVRFNQACERITGYTAQEVEGRCFWEFLLVAEEVEPVQAVFDQLRLAQLAGEHENYWVAKDGHLRRIAWSNTFLCDDGGQVEYVIGIGIDVTEQRRAEKERERLRARTEKDQLAIAALALDLAREKDVLQAIMDNTHACLAYLDPQFVFVRVNSTYAQQSGHSQEELLGHNHFELFPDEENQAIFEQVRDTGRPVTFRAKPFEYSDQPERGVTYWDWSLVPVQDQAGEVQGLVFSLLDVTEMIRAGQELDRLLEENRAQREFLVHLFESAPIGIAVVQGPEHRYEMVNPYYRAIPGIPGVPIVGRTVGQVFPDVVDRGALEILDTVYRTGQKVSLREQEADLGPERDTTWWDIEHVPLYDPDGGVERVLILAHGVTEAVLARRQIESLAREAQRQAGEVEAIVAAMNDAVVVVDAGGTVRKANPAAVATYGLDPVGKHRSELTRLLRVRRPDGRPVTDEELATSRAVQGEKMVGQRHLFTTSDGRDLAVVVSAAPLFDQGRVSGAVLVWHDVTEREQLLTQLADEQARLAAVIDNAPEGIVVVDDKAQIVLANPAAERLYNRSMPFGQEYGSHAGLQICYPDGTPCQPGDLPLTRSALQGETHNEVDLAIVWPDGQRRDLLVNTAPICGADGQVGGAVGIFQDITQRKQLQEQLRQARDELEERVEARTAELLRISEKRWAEIVKRRQAEKELRTSEERFRQLAENIREVFWLIDPASRQFLYVSPAFQELWGRAAQELYDRPDAFWDSVHPQDREALSAVLESGWEDHDREFRIVRPDGSLRWIRSRAFSIRNHRGEIYRIAGIVENITEHKAVQTALLHAERLATAGRLAASLAHEINNPLQSAMGCLDLASEALDGGRGNARRYLQTASDALARTARVVARLHTLHRQSQGEEKQPRDLNELMDRVLLLSRKKCQIHDVSVIWEKRDDLPVVLCMPDAMEQVLLNLVLNALEAMPDGGRLRVSTECSHQPEGVRIRFADTGPGVSAEAREQLFEPFHSTKPDGLGLGLFISQSIVQQHRGQIEVETGTEEGTVFTVWLPA